MTKKYFIEFSDYNCWANQQVISWIDKLSEHQWQQSLVSSFSSIEATTLHLVGAERVWLDRLHKKENITWLPASFSGSKDMLCKLWKEGSEGLRSFCESMPGSLLAENLSFKNVKGIAFNLPYYQLFAHIFNHSTYHRGQLVTLLRQTGFTELSSLDMITYCREKMK